MEDDGTHSQGTATAPVASAQEPATQLQAAAPSNRSPAAPQSQPAARTKPAVAYSLFPAVEPTLPATPVSYLQQRQRGILLQQQQQIQQKQQSLQSSQQNRGHSIDPIATSPRHRRSTSLDDSARTRHLALSEPRPSSQQSLRTSSASSSSPSSGHGLRVLHTAFSKHRGGGGPQPLNPGSGPGPVIPKRPMSTLQESPLDSPTVPSRFTIRSAQTVWSDDSGHGRSSSAPSVRPSIDSRREDATSAPEDGGGTTQGGAANANDALSPKWMNRQAMASTSTLHGLGLRLAGTEDETLDVQTVQARRKRDKPGLRLNLKDDDVDEKPPPPPPKSPRHHSRNRSLNASMHSRASSQASYASTRPQSPIAVAQSMTILKPTFVKHTHTSSGVSSTPSNRTDPSSGKSGTLHQPLRKYANAADSLRSDSSLSLPSSKFSTGAPSLRSNNSGTGCADGDRTPRPDQQRLQVSASQQAMRSTESVASVIRRSPVGQGPTSPKGLAPMGGNGQWVYRGVRNAAEAALSSNAGFGAPRAAAVGGDAPPPTPRKDGSAFAAGRRGEKNVEEEEGRSAAPPRSPRGVASPAQMAARQQERAPSRGPLEGSEALRATASGALSSHPPQMSSRGPVERSESPRALSRNRSDAPRAPNRDQADGADAYLFRTPPPTKNLPRRPGSPKTTPSDPLAPRIKVPSPDLSSSRSTTPDVTTTTTTTTIQPRPRSTADKPTPDLPRSGTPDQGHKIPEDPSETLKNLARQTEALHGRYASLRSDRQKLSTAIVSSLKESKAGPEYANTLLDQHLSLAAINSSMDICFAKLKSLECRKEEAMQAVIAQQASRRKMERVRNGSARSRSSLRSVAESGLESGRSTPELERRSPSRLREANAAIMLSKSAAAAGQPMTVQINNHDSSHRTIPSLSSATELADVEEVSSSDVDSSHGQPRKIRVKGAKAAKILGLVKESADAGQVKITLPDDVDRGAGLDMGLGLLSPATILTPATSRSMGARRPDPSPSIEVHIPSSPFMPRPPSSPAGSPQKEGGDGEHQAERRQTEKPPPPPKDTPPLQSTSATATTPTPTSASPTRAPPPVPGSPAVVRKPLPSKSTPPPASIDTSTASSAQGKAATKPVSGHTPTNSNAPSRADSSSDSAADEDVEARTPQDEEEEKPFRDAVEKQVVSPALSQGQGGMTVDQRLSGRTTVSVMGLDDDLLDYYQQT